jgi:pimeloyl-ACP methyl ester carboxylesterase
LAPPPPAPGGRPTPPTRDPLTPGFVKATELPAGAVPSAGAYGNFIIAPPYSPAPDAASALAGLQGTVHNFEMHSADSTIYPGIRREQGTFGTPDPNNPAKLDVTTSAPAPYTRRVAVYVPRQYQPGTIVPFIVGADGPDPLLFVALDALIAQKRVPAMVAISIGNGSGDAQGSQRGLEYDTMSGLYAQFVETEVLPLVEKQYNVKLTRDPNAHGQLLSAGGDFNDPEFLTDFLVGNARRLGTAGKLLFPIPDRGLRSRLYRILAPTHIVWGLSDRMVDPVYAEDFAREIPHAEVTVLDQAGHMVPYEQTGRVVELILGLT